jgi:hypothetical protein
MNDNKSLEKTKFNKDLLIARYKILNEKYPNIINRKTVLSRNITPEIKEALGISEQEADDFCRWYKGIKYKELLVEGADRYNLKGEITGQVTKEEARRAREIIEYRKSQIEVN